MLMLTNSQTLFAATKKIKEHPQQESKESIQTSSASKEETQAFIREILNDGSCGTNGTVTDDLITLTTISIPNERLEPEVEKIEINKLKSLQLRTGYKDFTYLCDTNCLRIKTEDDLFLYNEGSIRCLTSDRASSLFKATQHLLEFYQKKPSLF